ncbi:MAG: hypothetical protein K8T89_18035 [Planctomycetes bacterium]|nr:hypothetical protein [Planctomycetota bacterium]
MTGPQPRYSKDEHARRGTDVYERQVRPLVEAENRGKIAALDVDTGLFEVAEDNEALEPVLRLIVQDLVGRPNEIEAIVDTGFNGFLTVPASLIATMSLPWLCRQEGELADGSVQIFDVYVATVDWNGQPKIVEVDAADAQPLVGMSLMHGSELRIQVVPGGPVTIDEIT